MNIDNRIGEVFSDFHLGMPTSGILRVSEPDGFSDGFIMGFYFDMGRCFYFGEASHQG